MLGGGTGPAHGTLATTCTPGPWHIGRMMQAVDAFPMNLGLCGQGQRLAARRRWRSRSRAGACALKLHEDWGTTPAAIDCCLTVADAMDVQVMIHTDTLNESGFVENTLAAIDGPHHPRLPHRRRRRRPCARHHQGRAASRTSSRRRPTRRMPYTVNTLEEHLDMLMVCHHLDKSIPEDVAFAEIRHPARDHRGRGHPARPGGLLDHLVGQPGDGPGGRGDHPHLADRAQDEAPARAAAGGDRRQRQPARQALHREIHDQPGHRAWHLSQHIGSVEEGKRADLVLWSPAFFGAKPEMVLIGGTIVVRADGRPERLASPRRSRSTPGRCSAPSAASVERSAVIFVSPAAQEDGVRGRLRPGQGHARGRGHPRRHRQVRHDATTTPPRRSR